MASGYLTMRAAIAASFILLALNIRSSECNTTSTTTPDPLRKVVNVLNKKLGIDLDTLISKNDELKGRTFDEQVYRIDGTEITNGDFRRYASFVTTCEVVHQTITPHGEAYPMEWLFIVKGLSDFPVRLWAVISEGKAEYSFEHIPGCIDMVVELKNTSSDPLTFSKSITQECRDKLDEWNNGLRELKERNLEYGLNLTHTATLVRSRLEAETLQVKLNPELVSRRYHETLMVPAISSDWCPTDLCKRYLDMKLTRSGVEDSLRVIIVEDADSTKGKLKKEASGVGIFRIEVSVE